VSVHTPNEFLIKSGRVSSIEDLMSRFSVDVVTKEFFNTYRDTFFDITDEFNKNETFKREVALKYGIKPSDFVKKLMGQIVFLYFLQRKGWLGVRPGENWGTGDPHFMRSIFELCKQQKKNYYSDYLEPLFYECLGKADRGNSTATNDQSFAQQFNARIPYLNGGLFEDVYDWKTTNIEINNKVFEELLSFLDRFNFTVDENTPSDQEVSVDPEMLGKIFENLLALKDRKSMGAYYTPREIVHYMCRESLINYLRTGSKIQEERIRKLFDAKDAELFILTDENTVAKSQKLAELNEIAEKVDSLLKDIKIVDPAVGSGAFPMGMLSEISSTRYYLNNTFLHKVSTHDKPLSLYDIKRETLENCIYGVDLDPGAVEIAKLRFWLALVVDHNIGEVEALPNLDYKIMQGNSLLEEFEGIKLFDEKLLATSITDVRIFEPDNQKIISLQRELMTHYIKKPEWMNDKRVPRPEDVRKLEDDLQTLLRKTKKIKENGIEQKDLFTNVVESIQIRDQLQKLHKRLFGETNKDNKGEIKRRIENLEWKLIEATLREQNKTSELKKLEQFKKSNIKPFFLWKLYFADVFENGGFDIVIANPPYVSINSLSSKKDPLISYLKGPTAALSNFYGVNLHSIPGKQKKYPPKPNLYSFFFILANRIAKSKSGSINFIVPKGILTAKDLDTLRFFFINKNTIKSILLFKERVFDHKDTSSGVVPTSSIIIVLEKDCRDSDNKVATANIPLDEINTFESSYFDQASFIKNLENWNFITFDDEITKIVSKYNRNPDSSEYYNHSKNDIPGNKFFFDVGFILDKRFSMSTIDDKDKNNFYKLISLKGLACYLPTEGYYPKNQGKIELTKNSQGLIVLDQKYKIVWSVKNPKSFFFSDEDIIFPMGKAAVIASDNKKEIEYLYGLLNAKLTKLIFKLFLKNEGEKDFLLPISAIKIYFRVPKITNGNNLKKRIIELVDKIIVIAKSGDYLENPAKREKVQECEKQIDYMVYKLYNLTDEEIKIIEECNGRDK
jgi:hypothetical protein